LKAHQLKRLLEGEVFDVEGAAEYLGLKPNSIEVAALRGRIPFVHWSHKKLFCLEDLDYYGKNRGKGRSSSLQDVAVFDVVTKAPQE
jgi:hypothetical protein